MPGFLSSCPNWVPPLPQKASVAPPVLGTGGRHTRLRGGGGGNLQTDAAQLFLFVPIPAKAKKLGLLSIYKFSLIESLCAMSAGRGHKGRVFMSFACSLCTL